MITSLLFAAVVACSTSSGKLTLAREVHPGLVEALGLPQAKSWLWLGIDSDPLVWPRNQVLEVHTSTGRVVRARFVLVLTPDAFGNPQPMNKGSISLGNINVSLAPNDWAGARSRSTGKWNTKLFAGFSEPVSIDSVSSISVGMQIPH